MFVLAVEARNSTVKAIRVANAGVSSSATSGWVGAGAFDSLATIRAYAPDLTIINLGINDARLPLAAATYRSRLETIVAAADDSGDIVVQSVVPSGTSTNPDPAYEALYRDETLDLFLDSAGAISYIDIMARYGSYAIANPLGWYYDTIHPATAGYADTAGAARQFIQAV